MCPRLFHIYGPLWIQSYGAMVALGILVFLYFTYTHPMRKKLLSGELYLNALFLGLASGIIGGRLLGVAMSYKEFSGRWIEALYPWVGGFTELGSIIAVLIVVPWYLKKHDVAFLSFFDLVALYAPVIQVIARLGCFFAGCCYGKIAPVWLPWAVTFINPDGFAPLGVALHPTQLYTSIAFLLIFLGLKWVVYPYARQGQVLCSYLALASIARFFIGFFRSDEEAYFYALTHTQLLSCIIFILSVSCLFWIGFKEKS